MTCFLKRYSIFPGKWLLAIFLLFTSFLLNAQLPEIYIDLNSKNENPLETLEKISLQTGYYFTYDSRLIDTSKKINLKISDYPLNEVLDTIFNNPELDYKLIDKNIVIYFENRAEQKLPGTKKTRDDLSVKGVIKDSQSGEELAFATVLVDGTNRGTITNMKGEFTFIIPEEIKDPILVVSMIGYKNAYTHVNPEKNENLIIKLEKEVISLQEVIIRYQNPDEILRNMLKKIPANYLDEHSSMDAYFREYVKKNRDILTFSEAIIAIAKSPYTNYLQTDNVKIIRGRKLNNVSPEDSILLKIQSGVNSSLQLDIIKNLPDFVGRDYSDLYRLQFRNIVSYRNQQVFLIGFKPLPGVEDAQYEGDLYINKDDLALVAAEFEINPRTLRKNPERFLIKKSRQIRMRPLKARYRVEYRKTDGKYHISMAKAEVSFRVRKRKQWISSLYDIVIELAITEARPGLKTRIPRRDRLRPGTILSDEEFSYDPSFWGDYNIIEPEANLKEALGKLGIQWSDFEE